MNCKRIIQLLNIIVLIAIVIHVGIAMYLHSQVPSNSAPAWVNIIYAVYYLIPLAVIDIGYLIFKKRT